MKYIYLILAVFLFSCSKDDCPEIGVSDFTFSEIGSLNKEIKEASGIEMVDDLFWTFNDNSGGEILYGLNTSGKIEKSFSLDNDREDWEDITADDLGNLYIGDFGNNDNDRRDLKIIKIRAEDLSNSELTATDFLTFSLDDQTAFPPSKSERHFDIEAFFYFEDSFFLFSKDRADPFTGTTKLYKLPAQEGNHSAQLISEFFTDKCQEEQGAVTGADMSPDQQKVAILSQEAIWVFTDFSGSNFFEGNVTKYNLPLSRKMEGIVFKDECNLYLINEKADGKDGSLYTINICK